MDAPLVKSPALTDRLQRPLRDLRISVTDRCNFRCVYCMPKESFKGYQFMRRSELLSFEEIHRLASIFSDQGVRKIRLTGGEPLLRKRLELLVEKLAGIDKLDLTMTTNGSLLVKKAPALRSAGLNRLTVSLDAIDDATFRAMNDVDFLVKDVLDGIDAASRAGFGPIKINMVVKRGLNDHAILPMARHFRGSGHILRFIEYMDVGVSNGWRMDDVVPANEILGKINAEFPLEPLEGNYVGEVARRWRYADGNGEIGVIASVTQAFCADCNRLRLSTDGKLFTCLFATQGHDLRELLRSSAIDDVIASRIAAIWQAREDRYSEIRTAATAGIKKIEMSYIGG
ncbi:MAG: GTP 3',8-cyclase MoaA [Georgfuchsia sp.]